MQKPLAVEATVFWLIVTAIVELTARPTSETPGVASLGAIVIGILNLILAYLCWSQRKPGFVAAIVLSLFVSVLAYPYVPGLEATPYGAFIDAMVIISGLQTAFFGYRAFREVSIQNRTAARF